MIYIRPATLDDSPAIARIQVDSYRTAYANLLPADYLAAFSYAEQEQDWRDWLPAHPKDILLVAIDEGGETVGYALGRPGLSKLSPYDSELVALHVRQLYQCQGVGRGLVVASAKQLKQQGCVSLMLWVLDENPARGFYEHLGGKVIGEQTVNLGDGIEKLEIAYGWQDIDSLCGLPAPPE